MRRLIRSIQKPLRRSSDLNVVQNRDEPHSAAAHRTAKLVNLIVVAALPLMATTRRRTENSVARIIVTEPATSGRAGPSTPNAAITEHIVMIRNVERWLAARNERRRVLRSNTHVVSTSTSSAPSTPR